MKEIEINVDVGGIQNFIFSVYEGEGEGGGTAKTLRARSIYVSVLTDSILEVLKERLKEKLNLEVEEVLRGSGTLEIPLKVKSEKEETEVRNLVTELQRELDSFLIEKLRAFLSVVISVKGKEEVSSELLAKKRKRFSETLLSPPSFIGKKEGILYIDEKANKKCPRCRFLFYSEGDRCPFCSSLKELGQEIPKASHFRVRKGSFFLSNFLPFGYSVELYKAERGLNPIVVPLTTTDYLKELVERGILKEEDYQNLFKDESKEVVAPFEVLSLEAKGDKKLGYLKLDVDNLGKTFRALKDFKLKKELSDFLNTFFSEKVPAIAEKEFKPKLEGLNKTSIYLLYSGGDDLFAIAPWNVLLDFVLRVYRAFSLEKEEKLNSQIKETLSSEVGEYLTFSAGFVAVRPKFTARYSAELVDREERTAKNSGKNCISLFNGIVVSWEDLGSYITKAKELVKLVEDEKVPRNIFYKFLETAKDLKNGKLSSYPQLFYFIGRNVKDESAKRELLNFVKNWINWEKRKEVNSAINGALFTSTYVLMATRRE